MADQKEIVREYLYNRNDYYLAYHNHKENMAWVGTAIAATGLPALAHAIAVAAGSHHLSETERFVIRFAGVATIIVLAYLAWMFLSMQFDRRWFAAEVNAACSRRLLDLFNLSEPPRFDFRPADNRTRLLPRRDGWEHLPMFLFEARSPAEAPLARWVSAFFYLWRPGRWQDIDVRTRSAMPSLLVVVLMTALAIARLYFA